MSQILNLLFNHLGIRIVLVRINRNPYRSVTRVFRKKHKNEKTQNCGPLQANGGIFWVFFLFFCWLQMKTRRWGCGTACAYPSKCQKLPTRLVIWCDFVLVLPSATLNKKREYRKLRRPQTEILMKLSRNHSFRVWFESNELRCFFDVSNFPLGNTRNWVWQQDQILLGT